jgi:hypothetical protein
LLVRFGGDCAGGTDGTLGGGLLAGRDVNIGEVEIALDGRLGEARGGEEGELLIAGC